MTLGDVQACVECGASSEPLHDRGGRPFAEGGTLIATWRNGPFARHMVASEEAPIRCAWCNDRALGFPALSRRPDRGETWEVGGPLRKYLVPAWRPEQLVPRPDPHAPISSTPASHEPQRSEALGGLPAAPTSTTRPPQSARQLSLL
jgi:hypothetical protein